MTEKNTTPEEEAVLRASASRRPDMRRRSARADAGKGGVALQIVSTALGVMYIIFSLLLIVVAREIFTMTPHPSLSPSDILMFRAATVLLLFALFGIFLWGHLKYRLTCTGEDARIPIFPRISENSNMILLRLLNIPKGFRNPMPLEDVDSVTVNEWIPGVLGKITLTDSHGAFLEFAFCPRPEQVKSRIERLVEERKKAVTSNHDDMFDHGAMFGRDREIEKEYFGK